MPRRALVLSLLLAAPLGCAGPAASSGARRAEPTGPARVTDSATERNAATRAAGGKGWWQLGDERFSVEEERARKRQSEAARKAAEQRKKRVDVVDQKNKPKNGY